MRKSIILGTVYALMVFISTASATQRVVVIEEFTSTG